MYSLTILLVALFAVCAVAFHAPAATRPARMTMLFNFGKKASAPAPKKSITTSSSSKSYKINEGSANKGVYIPDGLTKEQYEKFLKAEEEKKVAKKKKFPLGKEVETLTEWMLEEKKKGNEGKALNRAHRLVKTKYDGWYKDRND